MLCRGLICLTCKTRILMNPPVPHFFTPIISTTGYRLLGMSGFNTGALGDVWVSLPSECVMDFSDAISSMVKWKRMFKLCVMKTCLLIRSLSLSYCRKKKMTTLKSLLKRAYHIRQEGLVNCGINNPSFHMATTWWVPVCQSFL